MIKKLSNNLLSIILLAQPLSMLSMTGSERALIEETIRASTNIRQLRAAYGIYQTRYQDIYNKLSSQIHQHEIQSATHSGRIGWGLFGAGWLFLGVVLTQEMLCRDESCEDKPSLKPLLLYGTAINLVKTGCELARVHIAESSKIDAQKEMQTLFQYHDYFLRGTHFKLEDEQTNQSTSLHDIIVAPKGAIKSKTKILHVN